MEQDLTSIVLLQRGHEKIIDFMWFKNIPANFVLCWKKYG